MPASIEWYVEQRILYMACLGELSHDDLWFDNAILVRLIQGGTQVHVILNTTHLQKYPIEIPTIQKALSFLSEPNLGWLILISQDRVVNMIFSTAAQFAKARFQQVTTMDEAVSFLLDTDPKLWHFMAQD